MVKMKNVSFHYENQHENETDTNGIEDINLEIKRGEVVLLCGESGCGKTTLTRLLNGLVPHYFEGELTGEVLINGKNAVELPLYETAKYVGSVFQNPRSQFFNIDTNSELAFSCENQGLPKTDIEQRIENTTDQLNLSELMNRSLFDLSGGEKQKIACGCVHAASPDIIVLDEPSSNLDAQGTKTLAQTIEYWKQNGKTIIIAEHRLHYLRDLTDRMIFMRDGKIEKEFVVDENISDKELSDLGLRPFSFESLLQKFGHLGDNKRHYGDRNCENDVEENAKITLLDFGYEYPNGKHALEIDTLSIPQGEIIAIVGDNGAGKSTFARCLCGLPKRFKGKIGLNGRDYYKKQLLQASYMVMQDVNHQLFTESVLDEVMLSMSEDNEEMSEKILAELNLLHMKERHPMSLSGGQKQRVAIASALASERELLIFDEPTSGLDLKHMKQVSKLLKELKLMGKTIMIISHDLELILRTCDRVLHFEKGQVKQDYGLRDNEKKLISIF